MGNLWFCRYLKEEMICSGKLYPLSKAMYISLRLSMMYIYAVYVLQFVGSYEKMFEQFYKYYPRKFLRVCSYPVVAWIRETNDGQLIF